MKKLNELQSYLTRLRGLVAILIILCSIGMGNAWAEPNDSAKAKIKATAGVVQGAPSSAPTEEGSKAIPDSFMWGILASAVVAIAALFVFFLILRPRIKISPLIAYQEKSPREGYLCEVALINRGIFSCNDIRVKASRVGTNSNESEADDDFAKKDYLSIKGFLHNENDSVLSFQFQLPDSGIPGMLRISVLAKHSVSGVEYAYKHVFKVNDFCEGVYERGKFIQKGNTYKQSLMRENIKQFKWIVPVVMFAIVLGICSLSFFLTLSTNLIILLSIFCLALFILSIIIWQTYIHSKADAYSSVSVRAYHKIEHIERQMLIAILGTDKEKESLRKSIAVDVEADQEDKEDKTGK